MTGDAPTDGAPKAEPNLAQSASTPADPDNKYLENEMLSKARAKMAAGAAWGPATA